jgi:hypothetical protein
VTEECWNAEAAFYHMRDRDSHESPAGKVLGEVLGNGVLQLFMRIIRRLLFAKSLNLHLRLNHQRRRASSLTLLEL